MIIDFVQCIVFFHFSVILALVHKNFYAKAIKIKKKTKDNENAKRKKRIGFYWRGLMDGNGLAFPPMACANATSRPTESICAGHRGGRAKSFQPLAPTNRIHPTFLPFSTFRDFAVFCFLGRFVRQFSENPKGK